MTGSLKTLSPAQRSMASKAVMLGCEFSIIEETLANSDTTAEILHVEAAPGLTFRFTPSGKMDALVMDVPTRQGQAMFHREHLLSLLQALYDWTDATLVNPNIKAQHVQQFAASLVMGEHERQVQLPEITLGGEKLKTEQRKHHRK